MRLSVSLVVLGLLASVASVAPAAPPVVRGPGMPPIPARVTPVVRPPSYAQTGGYQPPRFGTSPAAPPTIHLGTAPVPAFRPPAPDADRATLLAAGRALVARQAVRVKNLLPTSGFHSTDEIATRTARLGPTRAAAVELLRAEDKVEFAMRAPAGIRDSIVARGFLNQHDTGTTGGGAKDLDARVRVEASFLGLSRAEYDAVPAAIRPKYGFLRPARATGVAMADGAEQYGEDVFVFRRDAVKDHLTVYPLDSVANSALGWPVRPAAPGAKEPEATAWHQALVPWSERMLLAPDLDIAPQTNELRINAGRAPEGFLGRPQAFSRYIELQIWRPLGLAEVERFEFAMRPPSGAFLAALRANGVRIFKLGEATEWKGDAPS